MHWLGRGFGGASQPWSHMGMRLAAVICMLTVAPGSTVLASPPSAVREALLGIIAGKLDPKPFSVTYDDVHGLWGGLTLTIHGDGKVEQTTVRVTAGTPRPASREGVLTLVRLLLKEEAWAQRERARAPRPDESRAQLVIRYGTYTSQIWEWYNDLIQNQRIVKIRELMKRIAWTKGKS